MNISLPELSLVLLIGPSGCGKSTFARKHFAATEVLSSDAFRGMVSDDENDQNATADAFDALHHLLRIRLRRGQLTVVDATNVQPEDRRKLVDIAREYHVLPCAIVFDIPKDVCVERNSERPDRNFGAYVVRQQHGQMRRGLKSLKREGFRNITKFKSVEEVESVVLERQPLWNNKKELTGPFDIIGDVHGCCDELEALLEKLGYQVETSLAEGPLQGTPVWTHPEERKAVFLGDLVDRGPRVVDSLKLVCAMVSEGHALCVPGNHEAKLVRKLDGRNVQMKHGLQESWDEFEALPGGAEGDVARELRDFMHGLVSHFLLDGGRLVVAHAGMTEAMQGRGSGKVRSFALFGETTGETDEYGLPVRHNWAKEYRGRSTVVYGHTPVPEAEWLNNTICIDTGCVFGGKLTALRWPEKELVSIPAARTYVEPQRPLEASPLAISAQAETDDVLDAQDVLGKRIVDTRLRPNITIREENAIAALEVMSRFAVNPKWLIYLPPTMSPCATSEREGYLEYPDKAFSYYQDERVARVVCEQKHMGSRAVVILCKDASVTRERFGIESDDCGIAYTRTGRRFFKDIAIERALIDRLRAATDASGMWEQLQSDWMLLDCELMPWSEKAQDLLHRQYAPVGAAARACLPVANRALQAATARGVDLDGLAERIAGVERSVTRYVEAYRHYCWPVNSLEDLKLAPFHLLASEGGVHADKDHQWHMQQLKQLCDQDPSLLLATPYRVVELEDEAQVAEATAWWLEMTGKGGEGMVVKPFDFVSRGSRGFCQPAVKVRGPEYLRIIYGPDYDSPHNLKRLRKRGLGRKRSLAEREFALGLEAMERFVGREPLRRVRECVFGVLAMESEPVDPRL